MAEMSFSSRMVNLVVSKVWFLFFPACSLLIVLPFFIIEKEKTDWKLVGHTKVIRMLCVCVASSSFGNSRPAAVNRPKSARWRITTTTTTLAIVVVIVVVVVDPRGGQDGNSHSRRQGHTIAGSKNWIETVEHLNPFVPRQASNLVKDGRRRTRRLASFVESSVIDTIKWRHALGDRGHARLR